MLLTIYKQEMQLIELKMLIVHEKGLIIVTILATISDCINKSKISI